MTDAAFKVCAACRQSKPVAEFHKNSRMSDGVRSSCKPCTKAINQASIARHREKRLAEKRADYMRRKDAPEFKARRKAHQKATKAEKAEYDRKRHLANRKAVAERARAWIKANPERRRVIVFNYDSRRRSWIRGGVSGRVIAAWLEAQDRRCHWCAVDCSDDFHIDHIIPLSRGGEHELHNMAVSCPSCNLRKNAKMPEQFLAELAA